MSIEFNKLLDQVRKMGAMISHLDFDMSDKLALACDRLYAADDLDVIRRKIAYVRGPEISGYRGAAPLEGPDAENLNWVYPPPSLPPHATLIASDGSQVYPNEQSPVHYYLLNIGMFVYQHGQDHVPQTITLPMLAYHKDIVHDRNHLLITNRTVDARRTVTEMQQLAQQAWKMHREGVRDPLVTLFDNQLLFWASADVTDGSKLLTDYWTGMGQLRDADAILGGYVDNPARSRQVLRLLYLLSLGDEADIKAHESQLASGGDLEGLRDMHLFDKVLEPGERSAIMVQNSPRNLAYRQKNGSFEIAFFYVKVANGYKTAIARIDIPMWVARERNAVDSLHALILDQCQMQGRTPYPYALARADELALVSGQDRRKLDELIRMELRKQGVEPGGAAPKLQSKRAARSDKRSFQSRPIRRAPSS
ncbi:MAG: DNA double-strand break repair nuclease NurA [Anaerolineae bacterium]|nr:DNA double-strand break repair nuclease NurA [Anaerolineae bacterium]